MSKKVILLFAGQGAQVVGMGADLVAKSEPVRAHALLGMNLLETILQ
jgi:malonyl CoA-acyl carrier protein transacylase